LQGGNLDSLLIRKFPGEDEAGSAGLEISPMVMRYG